MKTLIFIIAFLLTITCLISSCFAQDTFSIRHSSHVFVCTSTPGSFPLNPQDSLYTFNKLRQFNFGLTRDEYCYILLKLQTGGPDRSSILSIDNTSLDTVMIFQFDPGIGLKLLYRGGNLVPYGRQRLYVWHTSPVEVSREARYYLVAAKAASKNINIAFNILNKAALEKLYRSYDRVIYFYLGVIFIIVSISLAGYLLFNSKGIVLYVCYILAVTAWVLSHYGYLFALLYPSHPSLNQVIKPVSCLLAVNYFLQLIQFSCKNEFTGSRLNRVFMIMKFVNISLVVVTVCLLASTFPVNVMIIYNISWNASILLSVCLGVGALVSLFKKSKTAQILLSAVGILSIVSLLQITDLLGHIRSRFLNDHGILLGSCLEILIMSYGVFFSIWEEKVSTGKRLQKLEEEQTSSLRMLVRIQDSERKRIAEDLHDSIGPMLAAIKINFLRIIRSKAAHVDAAVLITKTENIINDSISEIRSISHQLMPKNLASKGLITLLNEYFENLHAVYGISIQFSHEITSLLPEEIQLNIYRILCELVLNAAKHSHASGIRVKLTVISAEVDAAIQDNGKGFDLAAAGRESYGLKNVRNRIQYLKGTLNIHSNAAEGTQIKISIPFA